MTTDAQRAGDAGALAWTSPTGTTARVLACAPSCTAAELARAIGDDRRVHAGLAHVLGAEIERESLAAAFEQAGARVARLVAGALAARLAPAPGGPDGLGPAALRALAWATAGRVISERLGVGEPRAVFALGLLAGTRAVECAAWRLSPHEVAALEGVRADPEDGARPKLGVTALAHLLRHAETLADALCPSPGGHEVDVRVCTGLEALRVILDLAPADLELLLAGAGSRWADLCAALGAGRPAPRSLQELRLCSDRRRAAGERACAGSDGAQAPARPLRILACDDDPVSLRILAATLRQAGHEVATAEDGAAALRVALEWLPHAVIADWMMPEMDGVELCRAMRRSALGRNLFFLLLTGRGEDARVVEAFDAGVDDYVTKPFRPQVLLARLKGGQRVIELQERVESNRRLVLRQVAEMGLLTRKLRSAAHTDALTGLPNRRHALARLEAEWDGASADGRPLSVVMIDIDGFKRVNDENGHDVGDLVLREVATTLWTHARQREEISRLGGEEFFVICPGTTQEQAAVAAERLREAVAAREIQGLGFRGRVTVSAGVAERSAAMTSYDALIQAADGAVYAAKAAGRDRVATAAAPVPAAPPGGPEGAP